MTSIYSLFEKIFRFFLSKKGLKFTAIFLISFLLLMLIRSCSGSTEENNSYHIGRDNRWYFVNLMGKEKNLDAFVDNIFLNIARREKIILKLNFSPFDELLTKLHNREFDGILTTLEPDIIHGKTYLFSEPIILLGPVLVVPKQSQLDTWEELKYRIIGILNQSPALFEMSENASIQLKLYDNALSALTDLMGSKIDGVILPVWPAQVYSHTFFPDQLKIATTPLTKEGVRLVAMNTPKGKKLITKFNEGLQDLRKDGDYEKLINKWELVDPEKLTASIH